MLTTLIRRAVLATRGSQLTTGAVFRCSSEKEGEGSAPTEITKENAQLIIEKWVKKNQVVLFMKGTPRQPMCGYSNFVVELLKKYGTFDVN